jgi:hypothetical protein
MVGEAEGAILVQAPLIFTQSELHVVEVTHLSLVCVPPFGHTGVCVFGIQKATPDKLYADGHPRFDTTAMQRPLTSLLPDEHEVAQE